MVDIEREQRLFMERVAVGRICGCQDCQCCRDLAAYKADMAKREEIARARKHTIVPMHKSNYMVVTDYSLLPELTRPGRGSNH